MIRANRKRLSKAHFFLDFVNRKRTQRKIQRKFPRQTRKFGIADKFVLTPAIQEMYDREN